jgi:hypothetical protein
MAASPKRREMLGWAELISGEELQLQTIVDSRQTFSDSQNTEGVQDIFIFRVFENAPY